MAEQVLAQHLVQAAEIVEQQLDEELKQMDELEEDDLDVIRQRRLRQLKKMRDQKERWGRKGHGILQEIRKPEEFFEFCKKNERCVIHFYRETTERCKILNSHLEKLAKQHWETLFAKINAEEVEGMAERFNVYMLPTLMLVEGGKTHHSIIGFDEFGGNDTFPTERISEVLAYHGMVNDKGMFDEDQQDD
eukprot:TRINITY_DN85_c5_g1_i1.p1 TRINITY_DN85_c5_g1~~TRINITY_DN85_c5_g1_i1.p1  ORF type:complete len:191 (+),score=40.29 TRINITY_DN85_c5_g1_i1:58-630(+)